MRYKIFAHFLVVFAALGLSVAPAVAQVETIDPNVQIDADLSKATTAANDAAVKASETVTTATDAVVNTADTTATTAIDTTSPVVGDPNGYEKDDLIGAAEGVFGKGAEGLAKMIEGILAKQGRPVGYITGREAGGALVVGVRYGSGTLFHKVEGERQVYWTGPSVGFDAGANAAKSFVLVYNLHDTEDLYKRYPQGEGAAYVLGGFTASYLRRGNVVLIPIRLGVGARLGVNIGYMKFRKKNNWIPF